ncbi:12290_t:CDS:2, partial [Cetraspora pellucida]
SGNVNFCRIELDEGYELEVEEEEAFVTPMACDELYTTKRLVGRYSKRLEDKVEEQYRSILPRSKLSIEPLVIVNLLVALLAVINLPLLVSEAPDQVAGVLMLYNSECPPVKVTENVENRTFDKFEYEDEMLEEAKGYFTSEISDNELFDNL